MSTHRRRNPRRTHLFLVRVWTDGTSTTVSARSVAESGEHSDADGQDEWSGSVQRVVDGESHQFRGWQSLTDTLLSMLAETKRKT
jgi:hypothetical protein